MELKKHVVWMMQDNHSFDNYFGTYPGADGIPSGVCQRVSLNRKSTRGCVQPFHLGNAAIEDLRQGPAIQERQYNKGRMDGFVAAYRRLGQDGTSAMGYYDGTDIPFHWNVADQYVLFDRFFASTAIGSREAYLYWLAGNAPTAQTTLKDSTGYDELPTIFDRLAKRDIAARFYVENLDEAATRGDAVKRSSQLVKVPLLSMKRFQDGGAGRRPESVLHRPAQRHPAGRFVHCDHGLEREAAGRPRSRLPHRTQAHQRVDEKLCVVQFGIHVDLRRVGRLVRPRDATKGGQPRIWLPGACAAAQPLRKARCSRPHGARLHGHAQIH